MSIFVKLITAAKPFIYLPIYAALHLKLTELYDADPIYKLELAEPGTEELGDDNAIYKLQQVSAVEGRPAIAVCDPVELIDFHGNRNDFRVIGAFIKKPSFWLIQSGSRLTTLDAIPISRLERLIHYPAGNTGYIIANDIIKRCECPGRIVRIRKPLGQELDTLLSFCNKDDTAVAAVSGDVLGYYITKCAIERHEYEGCLTAATTMANFCIVYNLSTMQHEFLNTGFVIHKSMLENHKNFICSFLAAISTSVIQFNIASEPIRKVYATIANDRRFSDQKTVNGVPTPLPAGILEDAVERCYRHLLNEQIYSADLLITKAAWSNAIAPRPLSSGEHQAAIDLFDRVIDMSAAKAAHALVEKRMASVDTSTSQRLDTVVHRLDSLESGVAVNLAHRFDNLENKVAVNLQGAGPATIIARGVVGAFFAVLVFGIMRREELFMPGVQPRPWLALTELVIAAVLATGMYYLSRSVCIYKWWGRLMRFFEMPPTIIYILLFFVGLAPGIFALTFNFDLIQQQGFLQYLNEVGSWWATVPGFGLAMAAAGGYIRKRAAQRSAISGSRGSSTV